jgi:predicted MFS family arabinose efflux permease
MASLPRWRRGSSGLSGPFRTFWAGQLVSNLGGSFTFFALPLLVYRLTGSPVNLALTTVAEFIPYLLFGLVIGAWVDRLDRRRLMIACDLGRGLALSVVPLLAAFGELSIWWIYVVAFTTRTFQIAFTAAEFAAVKSLVPSDALETANGRIQASYQAAFVIGPLLAGAVVGGGFPVVDIFAVNACTFLVSAATLSMVRVPFNEAVPRVRQSVRRDVVEGLQYVFRHPILRNISILAGLVNLFGVTVTTQLVFFAKVRLEASDAKVGALYAAGALGIAALSLAAPIARKVLSFSAAALGALMLYGVLIGVLAVTRSYWVAIAVWAVAAGLPFSFSIHTVALRQRIVPDHLFGRVMAIAQVAAWSVNPLGAAVGGWAISTTGSVAGVFAVVGGLILVSTSVFWFTALGRVDEVLASGDSADAHGRAAGGTDIADPTTVTAAQPEL